MANDARIPNLALKFESDNIWPPFWTKNGQNWGKSRFRRILTVFWPKRGSNVIRFKFQGQIRNSRVILHLLDPHMKGFEHFNFLTSHGISKKSLLGPGPAYAVVSAPFPPGPGSAAFGARFPRAPIHQGNAGQVGRLGLPAAGPACACCVDFSVASSLYQLTEVRRDDTWLPSDDTRRRILLPSSIYTSRWKATFLQPYSLRCFSIFSKYVIPVLWKRSKQCNVT